MPGTFRPVAERGLVAGHQDVLQLAEPRLRPHAAYPYRKAGRTLRRAVPGRCPESGCCARRFPTLGSYLPMKRSPRALISCAPELLIPFMPGPAVALGQHGRALVGIQLRHGCPGVVTEHHARAGVVGIHPHVVRIVRGVVGAARSGAALRRHNRLRTDACRILRYSTFQPSAPQALPPSVSDSLRPPSRGRAHPPRSPGRIRAITRLMVMPLATGTHHVPGCPKPCVRW